MHPRKNFEKNHKKVIFWTLKNPPKNQKNRSNSKTKRILPKLVNVINKVEFPSFAMTPKLFDINLNFWRYDHLKKGSYFIKKSESRTLAQRKLKVGSKNKIRAQRPQK